jgi:hypothetical protein
MAALRDELEDGQLGVNEGVDASSSDEDVVGPDVDDDEGCGDSPDENDTPAKETTEQEPVAENDEEEGEVQESEAGDVAMSLDSDLDSDSEAAKEGLEAAKRSLLARLDVSDAEPEPEPDDEEEARMRLRINMRATLNMILTVAGEFYGQRDLLGFREPFVGM